MALVEVRPLEVKKWHGKKGKEAFGQPKTIEVLFSNVTGKYDTGLSEEEAKEYGKRMGADLTDTFNPMEPHPFWSSKASWVVLPNQTTVFNTDKDRDFVKVANLKASKFVANSLKEYNEGKFPDATHVIFSEEEEMESKAAKFELRQQASAKLIDYSLEARATIIQVIENKNVKGRSQSFVNGVLSEIVENKPEELLRVMSMDKEETVTRANVLELLQKGVLRKVGGTIQYMGEKLAVDYEDMVKYMKNPDNSVMKVRLLEQLTK